MSDIVTIAGSPAYPSRSSAILDHIRTLAEDAGLSTDAIRVRDLNADELISARADGPSLHDAISRIASARAVVIATPVYKAAYTGVLKAFLDVLPQGALADKAVFPIATGGSPAHLLVIDYALKPVLSSLGAQNILNGLYILDSQLQYANGIELDAGLEKRLQDTLQSLFKTLIPAELIIATGK